MEERRKSQKQEAIKQLAYEKGYKFVNEPPGTEIARKKGILKWSRPKSPELGFDSKGGRTRRRRKWRKTLRRNKRH